jgi:hypothetical protein
MRRDEAISGQHINTMPKLAQRTTARYLDHLIWLVWRFFSRLVGP